MLQVSSTGCLGWMSSSNPIIDDMNDKMLVRMNDEMMVLS